jgi:hypothetical protein
LDETVAFDPGEPVTAGAFTLTGEPVYQSYDLLGGGSAISGGTFSRGRWHKLLDEIARERAAQERSACDARLRQRAERRRRAQAAAELRRLGREAARAAAHEHAAVLAAAHGEAARAGLDAIRAAAERADAMAHVLRARRAQAAVNAARAAERDEEDAIVLLAAA